MGSTRNQRALDYHSKGRAGKIEVVATKPCMTSQDLSLAYTPGVADPCLEIEEHPEDAYKYTARGNLVGVVSNGTAVLGLGNIGALAGKPVMEGKGVLFKRFADIDVFDIELDTENVDEIVRAVQLLEPTFGGINLEDIKAPECFEIEERLKETMDIPVFHDDQHGTAIISGAALLNAAELAEKKMEDLKVVVSGAGAAAIACANLYIALGVRREHVTLVDSKGIVYQGRGKGMNKYKEQFAQADTGKRSLADAMKGADVFLGLSVAGLVSQDMIRSMAKDPIVFALANPNPEITYPDAVAARDDVIMATGRSDYPNQVNNVLGFPFIFRGALDVQARKITEEMKLAASHALADLARLDVPESVSAAYENQAFEFGREYIIPKPFDSRVLLHVAPAVAKAATEGNVARKPLTDIDAYREELARRLSPAQGRLSAVYCTAKKKPQRIVFPEGDSLLVMHAATEMIEEGLCHPILLGHEGKIRGIAEEHHIDLSAMTVIHPAAAENRRAYAQSLFELRQRKGVNVRTAQRITHEPNYYGTMMVREGDADGLITGVTEPYIHGIRPILEVLGNGEKLIAGMMMLVFQKQTKFLVDTTVNIDPNAEQLAEIAIMAADRLAPFDEKPRIAMLSYSTFGSGRHGDVLKVREATRIVKKRRPDLEIDGEMQADVAISGDLRDRYFPFTGLSNDANILVFPDLASANISYKLLQHLGGAEVVGPMLMGLDYAANVVQRGASTQEIVRLTALTAIAAQELAIKRRA
ncbi:MAG: NADP-dependent malic enzyme [Deltaproteobacteria bacterium]|nr:NADP-dependent malic enzyme [Deltaproteobacteria bacterium]